MLKQSARARKKTSVIFDIFLSFSLVASFPFFVSSFFLKNASTVGWNFDIFSAVSQPYPDSSRSGLWKCRLIADSWKLPHLQFRVSSSDFCTRVARSASNSRTTWLNDFSNVFTFSWSYMYEDKPSKIALCGKVNISTQTTIKFSFQFDSTTVIVNSKCTDLARPNFIFTWHFSLNLLPVEYGHILARRKRTCNSLKTICTHLSNLFFLLFTLHYFLLHNHAVKFLNVKKQTYIIDWR